MATDTYRVVSELARPGERLDVPEGVQPIVEPSGRDGLVRVTYVAPVTSIPIEDDSRPEYVE